MRLYVSVSCGRRAVGERWQGSVGGARWQGSVKRGPVGERRRRCPARASAGCDFLPRSTTCGAAEQAARKAAGAASLGQHTVSAPSPARPTQPRSRRRTLPSISPAFLVEFSMALMRLDCSLQLFSSMLLYRVCGGRRGGAWEVDGVEGGAQARRRGGGGARRRQPPHPPPHAAPAHAAARQRRQQGSPARCSTHPHGRPQALTAARSISLRSMSSPLPQPSRQHQQHQTAQNSSRARRRRGLDSARSTSSPLSTAPASNPTEGALNKRGSPPPG